MRTLYVVGLMAGIAFTLAASNTAKCRRDHLSLVRQLRRTRLWRQQLRINLAQAMPSDPRWQRGHLWSQSVL